MISKIALVKIYVTSQKKAVLLIDVALSMTFETLDVAFRRLQKYPPLHPPLKQQYEFIKNNG